jgi:D-alanyl-D-alanine dipeptidase
MKTPFTYGFLFILAYGLGSCTSQPATPEPPVRSYAIHTVSPDTPPPAPTPVPRPSLPARPTETYMDTTHTKWVNVATLEPSIRLDIRYATPNNFVAQQLYSCPACYLRPQAAYALQKAHRQLQQYGLGIKVYDCYRPQYIQQKLWDIKPDPRFVTNPTKGSMHSRGNAVDLTLVDSTGRELDMGTPFDYFGVQAYHAYTQHSEIVNKNRKQLLDAMTQAGFKSITTEWWHYSYSRDIGSLSDDRWACPTK